MKSDDDKFQMSADEALLQRFFAEAAQTSIADDGFTERVMAALPARQGQRLRLWSRWLNVVCAVSCLALLLWLGFFPSLWQSLHHAADTLVMRLLTFDVGSLLVWLMLQLRHLSEVLPSPQQLLTLCLGSATLLVLGILQGSLYRRHLNL